VSICATRNRIWRIYKLATWCCCTFPKRRATLIESRLEDRILDAFPSGNYGLLALLRLLEIVETTEVPTAAVECTELPRLRINPEFVERHAETPERLLMLVMHELHHVLLGHTRLFPRLTPVDNLIFDAVINALLCRMFPGAEHTSFFTRYYRDDSYPECLLRPAAGWTPTAPVPVPPALEGSEMASAREVYRALYSETGTHYQELYDALRSVVAVAAAVPLLGSHGTELEPLSGPIFEVVRSVVEHWPQPLSPIRGRSWSEVLNLRRVVLRPSNRAVLRALLRKVARPGIGASSGLPAPEPVAVLSPIPGRDRRAAVLRALGVPQLLYRQESPIMRRASCERVHVYLDVSGSIGELKGAIYGAVLDCHEFVHPLVHLFSTVVDDVSLTGLRQGECRTTAGTSIECVAAHMARHRVRRAVLLTDGFVGRPGITAGQTLSRAVLGVALTPGAALRTDLEPYPRFWAQLDEENEKENQP
jgi:hypothetical protein